MNMDDDHRGHRDRCACRYVARVARIALAAVWTLLVRNRLAIALASLVWLILRTGTKPSRIAYPCQQVAVINVGALFAGLIPALFLARRKAHGPREPAWVAWRRQVTLATLLFVAALVGVEGFQYAESLQSAPLPQPLEASATPLPATVGIAYQSPAGTEYTQAEIDAMVFRAIAMSGGLDDVVAPGDHVVLKPNLVQAMSVNGREGVVTDPRVCWAVVKAVKAAGAGQVTIAEGTAVGTTGRNCTWEAYTATGYDTNSDKLFDFDTSVNLFDLNNSGGLHQTNPDYVTPVTLTDGTLRSTWYIPNILLECDVLISVPTFKNHYNGTVTLSMKNRVGTIPNDIYHEDGGWGAGVYGKMSGVHRTNEGFGCDVTPCPDPDDENEIVQRAIVDLNLARPQDFAVVDGLVGIINGPNSMPFTPPDPRMHLIAAGRDSVALDAVCTLAMRYDPQYVPHLAYANAKARLGTLDPRYITVKGDHVMNVRSFDFPDDWGTDGAVYVETSPPTMTDISWDDDEQVIRSEAVSVTIISPDDNVGVIKAEVSLRPLGDPEAVPQVRGTLINPAPKDYGSPLWPALDTSEDLVLTFDALDVEYGQYLATVSIYDAAMNEASETRTINIVPPDGPLLLVEPTRLDSDIFVSETPESQTFTVRNIGLDTMCYTIDVSEPGPLVYPTGGCVEAGTAGDTITVTYDDFGPSLPPSLEGHAATIIVDAGEAENSPTGVAVKVVVTTVAADFDADGDVDSDDYGHFQACLAPMGQVSPECAAADFNNDDVVGEADRLIFMNCLSGARIPPDKDCLANP